MTLAKMVQLQPALALALELVLLGSWPALLVVFLKMAQQQGGVTQRVLPVVEAVVISVALTMRMVELALVLHWQRR